MVSFLKPILFNTILNKKFGFLERIWTHETADPKPSFSYYSLIYFILLSYLYFV